jgi:hypothetical protein
MSDLKYRFNEIIATINLLPDAQDIEEGDKIDPLFPNLTRDLHEPELYSAIICQTLKGDFEFRQKMSVTLANSAITNVMQNDKPNEDDMYALAIACNILWACGHGAELFSTMGVLGRFISQFDMEAPDLATAFLRSNCNADKFSKLDPYKILSGEYDPLELLTESGAVPTDILDSLRDVIRGDKGE